MKHSDPAIHSLSTAYPSYFVFEFHQRDWLNGFNHLTYIHGSNTLTMIYLINYHRTSARKIAPQLF